MDVTYSEHCRQHGPLDSQELSTQLETLIDRSRRGDESAFADLYRLTVPDVRRALVRYIGNADEIEDALQETYLSCWSNLDQYKPETNFVSWLTMIARHKGIDLVKRRRNDVPLDDEHLSVEHAIAPSQDTAPAVPVYPVTQIRQLLSNLEWTVFELRVIKGLTLREVAIILGTTINRVFATQRRATRRLRYALAN